MNVVLSLSFNAQTPVGGKLPSNFAMIQLQLNDDQIIHLLISG
ncbi:hypothetical protein [Paenibacillus pabuli]|nr:hypothetical protein [Paenibacillus pabuli]MEC0123142.1 hypothetical protein [Paenibacillus pabuli]